jgi:hypothetical protein
LLIQISEGLLLAKQHQSQLLDESFVSAIEKEGVKIVVRKGETLSYLKIGILFFWCKRLLNIRTFIEIFHCFQVTCYRKND